MVARKPLPIDPKDVGTATGAAVEFVRAAGLGLAEGQVLLEGVERTWEVPGLWPPDGGDESGEPAGPLWKILLSLPVAATEDSSAMLRHHTLGLDGPPVERIEREFLIEPDRFGVLAMRRPD